MKAGTTAAYYQYSGGQRVRKWIDKEDSFIKEERIYLGSFEIYRKFEGSSLTLERTTVHIADDTGRIAMLEHRTFGTDDSDLTLKRFIYSNHLQSAGLELDGNGAVISYEEYHPYGTTSYQASNSAINAVAKRYRYTGKERDEESGLNYHGARYYAPWLARWCAVDPLESKFGGMSPYNYGFDNPVSYNDPDGQQGHHHQHKEHRSNDTNHNIQPRQLPAEYYLTPKQASDDPLAATNNLHTKLLIDKAGPAIKSDAKHIHSSMVGKVVQAMGGEPSKFIIHYRPKGKSDNISEFKTIYSLNKLPSISIWGIPTGRPKMVQFIKEDQDGKEISHTSDIPLKNFGSTLFVGQWNPKKADGKTDDYDLPAINSLDKAGKKHDRAYDFAQASGPSDAITNLGTINVDKQLVKDAAQVAMMYLFNMTDPVNNQPVSEETYDAAVKVVKIFSVIVAEKSARIAADNATRNLSNNVQNGWSNKVIVPLTNINENLWKNFIY